VAKAGLDPEKMAKVKICPSSFMEDDKPPNGGFMNEIP